MTMYRVLLERGAEKDLGRLSSEIHDRVIAAIQALANNPRPPGSPKLAGRKNDWRIRVGDYAWFMKWPTISASCASTACGIAARFIADNVAEAPRLLAEVAATIERMADLIAFLLPPR